MRERGDLEAGPVIVIFGAKVTPDGIPSRAVVRRVDAALQLARVHPLALFLVTGGSHLGAPAEAVVMKTLLEQADVPERNIIMESASTDTLTSVVRCAEIIRALPASPQVIVCTDRYHIVRCRWLFSLLGIPTGSATVRNAKESNSIVRLIFWYLREIPATIWDTLLLLGKVGSSVPRSAPSGR